jgi:hypothetical protein
VLRLHIDPYEAHGSYIPSAQPSTTYYTTDECMGLLTSISIVIEAALQSDWKYVKLRRSTWYHGRVL